MLKPFLDWKSMAVLISSLEGQWQPSFSVCNSYSSLLISFVVFVHIKVGVVVEGAAPKISFP